MKKTLKLMATLAALLAMLGFVSCSSDDDDDDGSDQGQQTTTDSGTTTGGSTTDSGSTTGGSTTDGGTTTGGSTTDGGTTTGGSTTTTTKTLYSFVADGTNKPGDGNVVVLTDSGNKTAVGSYDTALTYEGASYTGWFKTGGKATSSLCIAINIPDSVTSGAVTAVFTSGGETKTSKVWIGTKATATVANDAVSSTSASKPASITKSSLATGTYYLNFDSNMRILKLEVTGE